jgi:3-deoxy-manno-octulosonate cytidylyltransferase (CMP-KDO synthetase)
MKFIGIIPARYASTRFPGKPLAVLGGKPVVQRVYEQVASVLGEAYVATDDERIFQTVERFGGRAVMTRADHKSGTDRIEEAAQLLHTDADVIINVQGDEPFIQKSQLETVKALFDDPQVQIGTLGKPFETMEQVENPNSPKIVTDVNGYALYFSRSVIPYIRDTSHLSPLTSHLSPLTSHLSPLTSHLYLKHIGLYAYRREVLSQITRLPQSPLELAESLEQLRWLQNGYRIKVGLTNVETVGIDTPEDLQRAETYLLNEK